MTLHSRNKIIATITIISFLVFITYIIAFSFFLKDNKLSSVPQLFRHIKFEPHSLLLKQSALASILSVLFMALYSISGELFVLLTFEKTKSSEIVYLLLFFVGCILQSSTILIAILELWNNPSIFLLFIGRLQHCGSFLCGISLLLFAINFGEQQLINVDRSIAISIAISFFIATIIPVNATKISSNFWMYTGFDSVLFFIQVCIFIIFTIIITIYSTKNGSNFWKSHALYGICMFLGYLLFSFADNYLFLILSMLLLFGGTYGLLIVLHKQYLWQ